jgi:hypothetical protein
LWSLREGGRYVDIEEGPSRVGVASEGKVSEEIKLRRGGRRLLNMLNDVGTKF